MRHNFIVIICKGYYFNQYHFQSVYYYQTINHINQTTRAIKIQTMIVYLRQECLIIKMIISTNIKLIISNIKSKWSFRTKSTYQSPRIIISITWVLQGMYLQQSHQLPLTDCVIILLGYDWSIILIWHQIVHHWK